MPGVPGLCRNSHIVVARFKVAECVVSAIVRLRLFKETWAGSQGLRFLKQHHVSIANGLAVPIQNTPKNRPLRKQLQNEVSGRSFISYHDQAEIFAMLIIGFGEVPGAAGGNLVPADCKVVKNEHPTRTNRHTIPRGAPIVRNRYPGM